MQPRLMMKTNLMRSPIAYTMSSSYMRLGVISRNSRAMNSRLLSFKKFIRLDPLPKSFMYFFSTLSSTSLRWLLGSSSTTSRMSNLLVSYSHLTICLSFLSLSIFRPCDLEKFWTVLVLRWHTTSLSSFWLIIPVTIAITYDYAVTPIIIQMMDITTSYVLAGPTSP